jgi:hypothetical protein
MKWYMPVRPIESGPVTSREIKELDAFRHAENGLFDGFICAVLSAPTAIHGLGMAAVGLGSGAR